MPLRNVVKFSLKQFVVVILVSGFCSQVLAIANPDHFPRPAGLEPAVQFWTRVFTEADTRHGFIHDDRYLGVVYEMIELPDTESRRKQQKYVNNVKKRYIAILKTLAKGKRDGLTAEQQRVLALWPEDVSNKTLRTAIKRIRFQLGQSNKYKDGLIRSGAWKEHILKTLDEMGLPREIASLPHVESSFNPKAYSRVGAAGLWQFTRSTGRRFMRVDHVVDERMDPFKASIAAARLLENNYAVTGSWPLALTAYNHGAAGMRNAAKQVGTTDILTIINKYKSRSFKFASRNFYVAFLAAVDVEHNAEKYFGTVKLDPAIVDSIVKLPDYMAAGDVARILGVDEKYLKNKNPALRPVVWNEDKYIPRGYPLRLDADKISSDAQRSIDMAAASKRYAKQKPDMYHRIRRGQTLSTIATRYGVSVREIVALNNLRSKHRIRAGQVLRLPQQGKHRTRTTIASARAVEYPVALPVDGQYTIRRGDTINRIARRYGLQADQLLAYNKLKSNSRIYPGQNISVKPLLPAGKAPDTTAAMVIATADLPESGIAANTGMTGLDGTSAPVGESTDETVGDTIGETSTDVEQPETDSPLTAGDPETNEPAAESILDENSPEQVTEQETALNSPAGDNIPDPEVATADQLAQGSGIAESLINMPAMDTADDVAQTLVVDDTQEIQEETSDKAEEEAPDASENLVTQVASVSAALAEVTQAELSADPSDYSVAKNDTIEIQAAETLGHYAEWLNLRASQLRKINKMRYGKPVVIGKRLKLKFNRVTREQFEEKRMEYHRELQENFFAEFQIAGTDKHKIRRGESVWVLAKRKYKIPIWLLRQYNPDLSFQKIQRGTSVTFPRLEQRIEPEATVIPDSEKDDQPIPVTEENILSQKQSLRNEIN